MRDVACVECLFSRQNQYSRISAAPIKPVSVTDQIGPVTLVLIVPEKIITTLSSLKFDGKAI